MSAVLARRIHFGTAPKAKYGNRKTIQNIDGKRETFASKRELDAFASLRLLEHATRIRNLKRQVPFKITVDGKLICRYIADFTFEEYAHGEWKPIVADAKGYPTPVYKLKKKLMAIVLGIEIREL